jgi:hypothetical protein
MTAVRAASDTRPTPLIAVSIETLAYVSVFIIACIFRAIALGAVPLGEIEARQALAVQHFVNPLRPAVGVVENPVTFAMMALSMRLMGFTDTAARIMPMFAGLALVFTPALFRYRTGRLPALVASLLLSISPIAVGLSRQVNGTIFAVLAFVIMLSAVDRYIRSPQPRLLIIAGVALGISLMADHITVLALLAMIIGTLFASFTDEEGDLDSATLQDRAAEVPWRIPLIAMVATALIAGSLFFLAPEGLGATADQLGRFAQGIISHAPDTSWVGISLLVYEPGLVIFSLAGIWLASQSATAWQRLLAGWGFVSLLVVLIYPGALPAHALWIVLPFAGLAGLTIASVFALRPHAPSWSSWLHGALVVAFFSMIFASLSQYLQSPHLLPFTLGTPSGQTPPNIPIDLILVGAWTVFLVILWLFFASIWEPAVAWRGVGIGLLALTVAISLGQSGSLAFTRTHSPYELLNNHPAQPGLNELVGVVDDIGELSMGSAVDPSISVQGEPSYTLIWALRNQSNVTFTSDADPTVTTDLVITPAESIDPALGSAYVGQDFLIVRQWVPRGTTASDLVKWVLYRTAPTISSDKRVILWVREDLYRLVPAGGASD